MKRYLVILSVLLLAACSLVQVPDPVTPPATGGAAGAPGGAVGLSGSWAGCSDLCARCPSGPSCVRVCARAVDARWTTLDRLSRGCGGSP